MLLWIGERGGEEEHTTHPNDLYSSSSLDVVTNLDRDCWSRNPWPRYCMVCKRKGVDVLSCARGLALALGRVNGNHILPIGEKVRPPQRSRMSSRHDQIHGLGGEASEETTC